MLEVWRQKAVRPNSQISSANQRFSERSEMKYQVISIIFAPIIMMVSTFAYSPATPSKSLESAAASHAKILHINNNTKKCDEPNGEKGGTTCSS